MNNALYIAADKDSGIKRSEVSIMGPCYFTEEDRDAGSARDDVLLWGDTTWASGFYNTLPRSIKRNSAFDVLDALVAYYMDRTNFPNLNVRPGMKLSITISLTDVPRRSLSAAIPWARKWPSITPSCVK